ncbi:hypothetical protein [Advenella sp. FME57]|nr:hypothetical protein [Advenella sp. FME57]
MNASDKPVWVWHHGSLPGGRSLQAHAAAFESMQTHYYRSQATSLAA